MYDYFVHTAEVKAYCKSKYKLSDNELNSVNWEAVAVAMKETKRTRRVFVCEWHVWGRKIHEEIET